MSVQTITQDGEDFVLLPHVPDWSSRPTWSRRWRHEAVPALTGAEERALFNDHGLCSLSWRLDPSEPEERPELMARLLAARKSGLACAPYWGRGARVVSSGVDELFLEATLWPWAAGDLMFIRRSHRPDHTAWDALLVDAVETWAAAGEEGVSLLLAEPLTHSYGPGDLVWPILFGLFVCEDFNALTDHHGAVTVRLTQRRPWPRPSGGCPEGEGWAKDHVDSYIDGQQLNARNLGCGWADSWADGNFYTGIQDIEPADSYIDLADLNGLNGGVIWAGIWVDDGVFLGIKAYDYADAYTDTDPLHGLNGGSGWTAAWVEN